MGKDLTPHVILSEAKDLTLVNRAIARMRFFGLRPQNDIQFEE
jgi:hypothetical protein